MSDFFNGLIGNNHIKSLLIKMIDRNRVGNSLLFAGPDGVGKGLFAVAFAKLIWQAQGMSPQLLAKIDSGNHPDIHIYRPEGKAGMHSIDTMRSFSEEVSMAPFEAKSKIFIIYDADRMQPASANALLKTFEEPSLDSIIILISSAPESLLPTIKSRCRTLHFHGISQIDIEQFLINHHGTSADNARLIAVMAHHSLASAVRLATQGGSEIRQLAFNLIISLGTMTYSELTSAIKIICDKIEGGISATEKQLRKEISHGQEEHMNAVQKNYLEKEVTGTARMKLEEEAHEVFESIVSWFRDIELLSVGGDKSLLYNPDYLEQLENHAAVKKKPSLDMIQQLVKHAYLALERSTSLQNCLETLFLKCLIFSA